MSKKAKAKITWLPPEKGGRSKPPIGPRYITEVRFDEDHSDFTKEAWSLIVEFDEILDDPLSLIATVRFLADEAPIHFLSPGNKFKLLEGEKIVANGEILS